MKTAPDAPVSGADAPGASDHPGPGARAGALAPPPSVASDGPGGSGGDIPVSIIRPALEMAWAVARTGLAAQPPVAPPGPLRPLVGFVKLGSRSLATVRAVVDGDADFRARVAEGLQPDRPDRPSWLWLARPEGWRQELEGRAVEAAEAAHSVHEGRAERSARRRLVAAEAALARRAEAAESARQDAADRLEDLTRERQARRRAESEAGGLRQRLGEALHAATVDHAEAASARRDAEGALEQLASATLALGREKSERARLEDEVHRLAGALEQTSDAGGRSGRDAAVREQQAGGAFVEAAGAAGALAAALTRAAAALVEPAPGRPGPLRRDASASASADAGTHDAIDPTRGAAVPTLGKVADRKSAVRRRPLPIPPGLFEDSAEAAAYLVRRPKVLLLVDGYNVSLDTWPSLGLAEQRDRLAAALGELAARTGAAVHIVYDASADEHLPPPVGVARRLVRVSFSETGQDADEVLIDAVDRTEPERPVVVVTDDRRLRTEVARRGANTLSVRQLLGVAGRGRWTG